MPHSRGASGRLVPLLSALLAAATAQALLVDPATARTGRGDGGGPVSVGNGARNRSIVYLHSPMRHRGRQHATTGTTGGATSVADGYCHRVRNCDLRQTIAVSVAATPL